MGKASKWIRNFLLMGKKEDIKDKKMCSEISELGSPLVLLTPENPKVKRRWSFKRKSTDVKPSMHKSTRSLDSISVPKQTLLEHETAVQESVAPLLLRAHAAATKIQAAYRSYLARRALRALRALVKLQALARGHLVRKQMNTVVRSMHAVIAIQVRARINRSRSSEQPQVIAGGRRSCSSTTFACDKIENENKINRSSLRSKSGRTNHTYHSRIFNSSIASVSQREYRLKIPPSPSMSHSDSSPTSYDGRIEQPRRYSNWARNPLARYSDSNRLSNCDISRSYMSNTESSKAKARSHSEPKQRPKPSSKRKGRKSLSMDGKNDKENQYPWLIKLYHRSRDCEDLNSNVSDMTSNDSKYMNTTSPFEPPMIIY